MESINKFKILTLLILFVFIFAVAAIYANTKDITREKTESNEPARELISDDSSNETNENLKMQVKVLTKRVDELNEKVNILMSESNR